jgi:DNA-binding NarL/FixJ family response regulator
VNKPSSRVFLVDDHPLVREWLTNLIDQHDDLTVCGEAESVQQALDGIGETSPDVAIVDLSLNGGSGLDVVKNVRNSRPQTAVIVLSMHDERLYAERALRAGARGYIMKRETTSNIIAAIHEVLSGKIHVSPQMSAALSEKFADGRTPSLRSPIEQLSDRELEVFQLLGQGFETRRVAQVLGVSIKTVQAYCARIKEKLELANASELLREAVRWNERSVTN